MVRHNGNPAQAGATVRARVLLADDFGPFRENVIALLPPSGNLELAGEAHNGTEAVELARTLRPDLVVMDYHLPGLDGVSAAACILDENPGTAILMSSLSFERPYVLRALTAGARGYLAKDDALDSLPDALNTVLAGRTYLSRSVAAQLARTAPPNPLSLTQEVLWSFDREAPALLHCARIVEQRADVEEAVLSAFRAFWMTLRGGQPIPDPQTWLLVSVAARIFPGHPAKAWSISRAHPLDSDLKRRDARLGAHVAGCRSCHLAWVLATHDPKGTANIEGLRARLIHDLELPDEGDLFVEFARRQADVMRLAAAELELLLGAGARAGWMRREAAAGRWLHALLGSAA